MFVQIHMLQSAPPGNLNRDDSGQPKKCLFGGVTRARISSQCLKRRMRWSEQFKEGFGDRLATRTTLLPRMVVDALQPGDGIPEDDHGAIMAALAAKFRKESRGQESEAAEEEPVQSGTPETAAPADGVGKTPQLVFFPPPFAREIAKLLGELKKNEPDAYAWLLGTKKRPSQAEKKTLAAKVDDFCGRARKASESLTVDIALFGRMTTSNLVADVEAACQVAHAIGTHETMIESDYFTAMDDEGMGPGAGFIGSGDTETFFNASVYYKYVNVDIDALQEHLPSLKPDEAANVAGVLISAAALANPTGKQNAFASYGAHELILVEVSEAKRPLSYANAFLQPVEGGTGRNFMTESAGALRDYVDSVAAAFAPKDISRVLLAVGPASVEIDAAKRVATLDELVKAVVERVTKGLTNRGKKP
jgi:CRISPR system Cascade subunit CasC